MVSGLPALADIDAYVAAVGPAQWLQPLQERRDAILHLRVVRAAAGREQTDPPHAVCLVRAGGERPSAI
jgi:hypothetical protein